jgi:ADP-heptose:LPS heptosyltransferase
MKILIKAMGFIGDNLFATSVAKKLKYKYTQTTTGLNQF